MSFIAHIFKSGFFYPKHPVGFNLNIVTATKTLTPAECGLVVVKGGADVVLTLPPVTGNKGLWYLIAVATDFHLQVATPTADTLIAFNDVAADNIAFSTDANNVGGMMLFICDGVSWIGEAIGGGTRTVNS